jgi:pyridoxal phosphate enzyme (YggS family)
MTLKDNLTQINERMQGAKAPNGPEVKLIAVSKTETNETIKELYGLGQRDFAESRPQVLRDRLRDLADLNINWHFIGPLQSNKIKYVYPKAYLVHSIDRVELIESFIQMQKKTQRICPILLQVHISGEAAKQGFAPDEILQIIEKYNQNPSLSILGLMGMAPLDATEETTKACFSSLNELFIKSKALEGPSYKAELLSMGMSQDFELAIQEGANLIRVGSALFKK